MANVLNPYLYSSLVRNFRNVRIGQQGQAALRELAFRTNGTQYWQQKHGEAYYVNCPFCKETRQRLHISHLWCVRDAAQNTMHKSYIYCFNTSGACTTDPYNVDKLMLMVFGGIEYSQLPAKDDLNLPAAKPRPLETELPGRIVSLASLPEGHIARAYVRDRGFDPDWLSSTYQVGYCTDAVREYAAMWNRLYMPIYMHGKLAGWQGRYLHKINHKETGIPKYYTYRYMDSSTLYNFDVASKYDVIVLVEGVTKVWAVGPQSMAYFGVMNAKRAEVLARVLKTNGRIVYLPDGDAWRPLQTGRIKAVEGIKTLQQFIPASQLVPLQLPDGIDPGDLNTPTIRTMILDGLTQSGWSGDFDAQSNTQLVSAARRPRFRYVEDVEAPCQ